MTELPPPTFIAEQAPDGRWIIRHIGTGGITSYGDADEEYVRDRARGMNRAFGRRPE